MFKRLITLGCSFTFGHGLADCFVPPDSSGKLPSKLAWPSLLSTDLNLLLVNNSRPGASNLEILYNLLEFNILSTDLVIIMWSFPDRDLIFQNKDKIFLGTWEKNDLVKYWALTHNTEDLAFRSWLYIHHASCYLSQKGIKFYNIFANYEKLREYKPDFLNIDYLPYDMSEKIDYSPDNMHPGPETHRLLADKLKVTLLGEPLALKKY